MKSDSQLQQDVMAELKWEPAVLATQIGVETKAHLSQSGMGTGTDANSAASAKSILSWTGSLPADVVKVMVENVRLTLTGTVHSWAERELATRSAWRSAGVRNVHDRMNLAS